MEDDICVCQSPADDLLLAVVVSSLDALGHVSQSGEARLSGQSVGGEGFQTPAGRLSLLQGGESSDVLPPDQTQRVLQVPFPQRRLREEDKDYLCLYPSEFREQHTHTSAVLLHRLIGGLEVFYLPPKLLGELLQALQAEQRLLQSSLSLMFSSLQQNPTLLDVAQGFTFKYTKHSRMQCYRRLQRSTGSLCHCNITTYTQHNTVSQRDSVHFYPLEDCRPTGCWLPAESSD